MSYSFTLNVNALESSSSAETVTIEEGNSTFNATELFEGLNDEEVENAGNEKPNITESTSSSSAQDYQASADPLEVTFKSISQEGLIVMEFNQKVTVPEEWQNMDDQNITIAIVPGPETDESKAWVLMGGRELFSEPDGNITYL